MQGKKEAHFIYLINMRGSFEMCYLSDKGNAVEHLKTVLE